MSKSYYSVTLMIDSSSVIQINPGGGGVFYSPSLVNVLLKGGGKSSFWKSSYSKCTKRLLPMLNPHKAYSPL